MNDKRLPGKPDIAFPKHRTAIFVHGRFWHGHRGCIYYTIPKTNTDFWIAKISRNQERDQEVWRQLEAKGWFVIIVLECQLKTARLQETVEVLTSEIRKNGEIYQSIQFERKNHELLICWKEEYIKQVTSLLTEIQTKIK